MFNMPNAEVPYNLINKLVKDEEPLNISLIFDKFVNKFVTGYANGEKWIEGKQSEIKRQLYLINRERVKIIEELSRVNSKRLEEIIKLLEECDVENATKKLRKLLKNIKNKNLKNLINKLYNKLLNIKLSISASYIDQSLYSSYYKRIKSLCQDLRDKGYEVVEEKLKLKWRLAINLGAASVYETSVLLHRNYSIPYIPGSAIKGVTRHWAILKLFNQYCKNYKGDWKEISCIEKIVEDMIEENLSYEEFKKKFTIKNVIPSKQLYEFFIRNYNEIKSIQNIFGTQNRKGKVIFFDAIPLIDKNDDLIVLDVINVHYRSYYEGKDIPGDWHDPVPIFFFAIEKGTKFRFVLASKDKHAVLKARELLIEALNVIGIGAKTSVGYGYFDLD